MTAHELAEILRTVIDSTGTPSAVRDSVVDAKHELSSSPPNYQTIVNTLTDAETTAIEADYSQSVIDLLALAVEHTQTLIDSKPATDIYTVPPKNIPENAYPQQYEEAILENNEVFIVFHPGEQLITFVTKTAEAAEYAQEHCTVDGVTEIYGPYSPCSLSELETHIS